MIKSQSISVFSLSTCLLIGLAAILCNGCATDGFGKQAAYDCKIQRTEQLLIAAGDADSLASAAMLSIGPTVNPGQRLKLIAQAVLRAPDRPDLVWLNVRLCTEVEDCNPEPLEAQLRALDAANGAGWFDVCCHHWHGVGNGHSGLPDDRERVQGGFLAGAGAAQYLP